VANFRNTTAGAISITDLYRIDRRRDVTIYPGSTYWIDDAAAGKSTQLWELVRAGDLIETVDAINSAVDIITRNELDDALNSSAINACCIPKWHISKWIDKWH